MAKQKFIAAPRVQVMRLAHGEGLDLPAYKTVDAAGMDLLAAVDAHTPLQIAPGKWIAVPTGLALRHGVTVLNSPGTIDADYRGEVQVLLINHGPEAIEIQRGDRIAQLIVAPVVQMSMTEVGQLSDTARGAGGFGSTGVRSATKLTAAAKTARTKASKNVPARAVAKRTRLSKSSP